MRAQEFLLEEKLLDPEEYGLELPTSTVRRIVTAVVAQVDPTARVRVGYTPEGYYIVSTDNDKLQFDFGITAQGGEISANIVNAYAREDYLGTGIVTKIIDLCFKAMVKKYGKPEKFVISTQEDKGHGVWQHIAQKLGAEWGGSMMENFADGKKPGRKGLAKRVGVPTKASVSKLRSIAAHSSGEKQRMAHWMANMKAGKQKKNESEMDEGWKQNVAAGVLGAGMALGSGAAQADTDVFNKKFTPAEIQQLQTKADLTQRYYNELVRRAKEDGRIMDRTTLNMLKAQAEDAAARSVQQRPEAPQAKSALPGTQPSEIRRSANYHNFESVKK